MYKSKGNIYKIPMRFYPKYQIAFIIAIAYFNFCTIALDIFLFYEFISKRMNIGDILMILTITLLFYLYVLYLDIDLVNSLILKRQYVEINYEGIIIKRLFKEIVMKWNEVYEAEQHSYRGTNAIRISRKKDIMINKYLRIIGKGFGLFYIEIKKSKYKDVEINKFINTIGRYMKRNDLL